MATLVNTKKVADRRTVRYANYQELLDDAARVAHGPHRVLGNWSAGQVFRHIATVMNSAIDGAPFRVPWYIRWPARLLKKVVLGRPMPAGFKLPPDAAAQLVPPETSAEEGLDLLRRAVGRLAAETQRAPSPVFGPMTREEWDRLQLNHAALHMSFLVPT